MSYWLMTSAGFLVLRANCPPNYNTRKKTVVSKYRSTAVDVVKYTN